MTRRAWLLVAVVVTVGVVAGAGGVWLAVGSGGSGDHTLSGRITESGLAVGDGPAPVDCRFPTPGPGAGQIIVKNDSGILVGVGPVEQRVTSAGPITTLGDLRSAQEERCEWTFSVRVKASDFYTITIGTWKPLVVSSAVLAQSHWRLDYDIH